MEFNSLKPALPQTKKDAPAVLIVFFLLGVALIKPNGMSKTEKEVHDIVADIRDKLSPFWCLVDTMLLEDDQLPQDMSEYVSLMEETAIKCRENQELITSKLDELVQ